ncbi:hypothetical protein [Parapedobacter indicus]|uniref:Glycosyl hydrolases family 39 n=1 Tax=Parapedobacter indicus TaxID=1477437 RepID=A0A1I3HIZ4_9SPHI|nr:hypothetical protein [Parapedobacter indicus]PPL03056.1 glycosyl hydrolase family 39 [Parapedobacter indicus]SFI35603.1 Glycosyl hydrolases family 39 [Parapedobacter indicus]
MKITMILTSMLLCKLLAAQVDGVYWEKIGKIKPRNVSEITSNTWSIGAETMDRGYTIYENWKSYLAPLGFKKCRIQSGWARTEQEKGVYDFAWLDSIVFDMKNLGVTPWINVGYGNPIYGGDEVAEAGVPDTPESLVAWDNWLKAMVKRYKGVVHEWEIWNEPNYRISVDKYATLLIRSAEVIRTEDPESKILAFALGSGVDYHYVNKVLKIVEARNKISLVDEITFHRHQFDPDDYKAVDSLRKVVNGYDTRITIRQGESGAPTQRNRTRALNNYDWTEISASKWALRRLLNDFARAIPSSYFGIMEMKYPEEINAKGLLESDNQQHVVRPKMTYSVLQHLASIFDDSLVPLADFRWKASANIPLSVYAFEQKETSNHVISIWLRNGIPNDFTRKFYQNLNFQHIQFKDPVYVDMLTGDVFEIDDKSWNKGAEGFSFFHVPLYDSPVLLIEKSLITIY